MGTCDLEMPPVTLRAWGRQTNSGLVNVRTAEGRSFLTAELRCAEPPTVGQARCWALTLMIPGNDPPQEHRTHNVHPSSEFQQFAQDCTAHGGRKDGEPGVVGSFPTHQTWGTSAPHI